MRSFTEYEYGYLEKKNILILKPFIALRTQVHQKFLYEKAMKDLRDLIVAYNYPNVLTDTRRVGMDFSAEAFIDRPNLWNQLKRENDINIKIAVLLDKIDEATKVRMNRYNSLGYNVLPFIDYDKAMEWLLE
jgi:hypothetical protein